MIPLMIILAAKYFGYTNSDVPAPKISVGAWLPTGDLIWSSEDLQGDVKIENNTISARANIDGMRFVCNASYPVQWDFAADSGYDDNRRRHTVDHLVKNSRTAADIFNKSTFEYIAELQLYGEDITLTGNYSCRSSEDALLMSWLYVFWEGNSPPYMLNYNETSIVYVPSTDAGHRPKEDQMVKVVLPCRVSVRTVDVQLQKRKNGTWQNLANTEFASYDPYVGFNIVTYREAVFGKYQCVVTDSPVDDQRVIVVKEGEPPSSPFQEYVQNNASFLYDNTTQTFTCCSDNWQPPAMQIVYCDHPTLCDTKKKLLQRIVNNGRRHIGKSCTTSKITFQTSGVLKCVGSGISVFREYFFPVSLGLSSILYARADRSSFKFVEGVPYYRWEDVDPVAMISIESSRNTAEIFAGQSLTLKCKPSQYYFADGSKWLLTWSNHSRLVTDGTEMVSRAFFTSMLHPGHSTINVLFDANLTQVSCVAPVWNSSQYVIKTVSFSPKLPETPTIDRSKENMEEATIFWHINETKKSLECLVNGLPLPTVIWRHDGKIISKTRSFNGTSTLVFDTVNFTTHGTYVCKAMNVGGEVKKTFHVDIKGDAPSTGWITGIVLLTLFSLGTVLMLGFLAKRIKDQAVSIDSLRTVAFKDVLEQQHGFSFINGETILDATGDVEASIKYEDANEVLSSFSINPKNISYQKF